VKLTPAEEDFLLVKYEAMVENIAAYADTAIQYGYTMLFITALPIATFLSLVNNWARVKFYLYKLFNFYQRPAPAGAQDIGTWMPIFQFLSIAAVITNGGLICFTMDVLWDRFSLAGRLWIFIGFQWVLIAAQFVAQAVIDDCPREVEIQLERMEFINLKIIERVADEEFGMEIQVEDDDEVEEGKFKRGPRHCGNIWGIQCKKKDKLRGKRVRKMRTDIADYPEYDYPMDSTEKWPQPLHKSSKNLPTKSPSKADVSHASAVAHDKVMPPPPPGYV